MAERMNPPHKMSPSAAASTSMPAALSAAASINRMTSKPCGRRLIKAELPGWLCWPKSRVSAAERIAKVETRLAAFEAETLGYF